MIIASILVLYDTNRCVLCCQIIRFGRLRRARKIQVQVCRVHLGSLTLTTVRHRVGGPKQLGGESETNCGVQGNIRGFTWISKGYESGVQCVSSPSTLCYGVTEILLWWLSRLTCNGLTLVYPIRRGLEAGAADLRYIVISSVRCSTEQASVVCDI